MKKKFHDKIFLSTELQMDGQKNNLKITVNKKYINNFIRKIYYLKNKKNVFFNFHTTDYSLLDNITDIIRRFPSVYARPL